MSLTRNATAEATSSGAADCDMLVEQRVVTSAILASTMPDKPCLW
jgi:hypothetical protein